MFSLCKQLTINQTFSLTENRCNTSERVACDSLGADHLTLEGGGGVGDFEKKFPASACRKKKIACSTNVIEKNSCTAVKKYPTHQVARKKKILQTINHPPTPSKVKWSAPYKVFKNRKEGNQKPQKNRRTMSIKLNTVNYLTPRVSAFVLPPIA